MLNQSSTSRTPNRQDPKGDAYNNHYFADEQMTCEVNHNSCERFSSRTEDDFEIIMEDNKSEYSDVDLNESSPCESDRSDQRSDQTRHQTRQQSKDMISFLIQKSNKIILKIWDGLSQIWGLLLGVYNFGLLLGMHYLLGSGDSPVEGKDGSKPSESKDTDSSIPSSASSRLFGLISAILDLLLLIGSGIVSLLLESTKIYLPWILNVLLETKSRFFSYTVEGCQNFKKDFSLNPSATTKDIPHRLLWRTLAKDFLIHTVGRTICFSLIGGVCLPSKGVLTLEDIIWLYSSKVVRQNPEEATTRHLEVVKENRKQCNYRGLATGMPKVDDSERLFSLSKFSPTIIKLVFLYIILFEFILWRNGIYFGNGIGEKPISNSTDSSTDYAFSKNKSIGVSRGRIRIGRGYLRKLDVEINLSDPSTSSSFFSNSKLLSKTTSNSDTVVAKVGKPIEVSEVVSGNQKSAASSSEFGFFSSLYSLLFPSYSSSNWSEQRSEQNTLSTIAASVTDQQHSILLSSLKKDPSITIGYAIRSTCKKFISPINTARLLIKSGVKKEQLNLMLTGCGPGDIYYSLSYEDCSLMSDSMFISHFFPQDDLEKGVHLRQEREKMYAKWKKKIDKIKEAADNSEQMNTNSEPEFPEFYNPNGKHSMCNQERRNPYLSGLIQSWVENDKNSGKKSSENVNKDKLKTVNFATMIREAIDSIVLEDKSRDYATRDYVTKELLQINRGSLVQKLYQKNGKVKDRLELVEKEEFGEMISLLLGMNIVEKLMDKRKDLSSSSSSGLLLPGLLKTMSLEKTILESTIVAIKEVEKGRKEILEGVYEKSSLKEDVKAENFNTFLKRSTNQELLKKLEEEEAGLNIKGLTNEGVVLDNKALTRNDNGGLLSYDYSTNNNVVGYYSNPGGRPLNPRIRSTVSELLNLRMRTEDWSEGLHGIADSFEPAPKNLEDWVPEGGYEPLKKTDLVLIVDMKLQHFISIGEQLRYVLREKVQQKMKELATSGRINKNGIGSTLNTLILNGEKNSIGEKIDHTAIITDATGIGSMVHLYHHDNEAKNSNKNTKKDKKNTNGGKDKNSTFEEEDDDGLRNSILSTLNSEYLDANNEKVMDWIPGLKKWAHPIPEDSPVVLLPELYLDLMSQAIQEATAVEAADSITNRYYPAHYNILMDEQTAAGTDYRSDDAVWSRQQIFDSKTGKKLMIDGKMDYSKMNEMDYKMNHGNKLPQKKFLTITKNSDWRNIFPRANVEFWNGQKDGFYHIVEEIIPRGLENNTYYEENHHDDVWKLAHMKPLIIVAWVLASMFLKYEYCVFLEDSLLIHPLTHYFFEFSVKIMNLDSTLLGASSYHDTIAATDTWLTRDRETVLHVFRQNHFGGLVWLSSKKVFTELMLPFLCPPLKTNCEDRGLVPFEQLLNIDFDKLMVKKSNKSKDQIKVERRVFWNHPSSGFEFYSPKYPDNHPYKLSTTVENVMKGRREQYYGDHKKENRDYTEDSFKNGESSTKIDKDSSKERINFLYPSNTLTARLPEESLAFINHYYEPALWDQQIKETFRTYDHHPFNLNPEGWTSSNYESSVLWKLILEKGQYRSKTSLPTFVESNGRPEMQSSLLNPLSSMFSAFNPLTMTAYPPLVLEPPIPGYTYNDYDVRVFCLSQVLTDSDIKSWKWMQIYHGFLGATIGSTPRQSYKGIVFGFVRKPLTTNPSRASKYSGVLRFGKSNPSQVGEVKVFVGSYSPFYSFFCGPSRL